MLVTKFKTALDVFRHDLTDSERLNVNVTSLLSENEKLRQELEFYKQSAAGKIFDL
jgi:cell shape-determining protein MreC